MLEALAGSGMRVGCAGWAIAKEHSRHFPTEGTHLTRYAALFPAVEINSSFYRLHGENTYRRWAASVPGPFRFSVKIPREITHQQRLKPSRLLEEFLSGPAALGEKFGPLLVQLPAAFALDPGPAGAFFAALRKQFKGSVVCEPRHSSWFSAEAQTLLEEFEVGPGCGRPRPGARSGRARRLARRHLLPTARLARDVSLSVHGSLSHAARGPAETGTCAGVRLVHLRQHGSWRGHSQRHLGVAKARCPGAAT